MNIKEELIRLKMKEFNESSSEDKEAMYRELLEEVVNSTKNVTVQFPKGIRTPEPQVPNPICQEPHKVMC